MTDVMPSPSGIPAVDHQWGGLASGGAYLLVGRAGAGRSALALRAARAAVDDDDRVLVISPRAPEALVEVGQEIGLDLAGAHQSGHLRLLRIPSAAELGARGAEGLKKSYRDLVGLVASDRPSRVVVEDFTPLVQFDTFASFRAAFEELITDLQRQEVTLVIGLGEPGNDASRRLLEVVESLVDGTIRLSSDGEVSLDRTTPSFPASDGASVEATAPSVSDPASPSSPEAISAPLADPPTERARPAPPADDPFENPAPSAKKEPDSASEPETADREEDVIDPFEQVQVTEEIEEDVAQAAQPPSDAPSPTTDSAPEPSFPVDESAAPTENTSGSNTPPPTDVIPPPAPDPSLLVPSDDPFGYDPADTMLNQGYLADSSGGTVVGHVPSPPAQASDAQQAPALPSFAPLGAASTSPEEDFRSALEAAFANRAHGASFVIVALRMEPSAPEAAHFGAVEDALRKALRPSDRVLVDAERRRAVVILPDAQPDASQALFTGLQSHLATAIGTDAERVRQAIGAVTVPDGQPFQTADDLLAYAYES